MIKTSIAAALALALAAGTAMAEFKDFTVNGELVTKAQQEAVATEVLANSGNPHQAMMDSSIEEQVKDMIIETKVMGRYARQKGLDKDPAVQEQIARATDMILMQQAVNKFLKENPVKEETIKAEYDKEVQRWGDTEVRVRHILVKTEAEAKDLIDQINKGASFDPRLAVSLRLHGRSEHGHRRPQEGRNGQDPGAEPRGLPRHQGGRHPQGPALPEV